MTKPNKYHYHGKPCIKCGSDLRYIKTNNCVQCKSNYDAEWRQSNKTHHSKKCLTWRRTHPEYQSTKSKGWRQLNKEHSLTTAREWHANNPGAQKAYKAVHAAINRGDIQSAQELQCVDRGTNCAGQASHYHHESYAQEHWLDVIPLCQSCHRARHTAALPEVPSGEAS